MTETDKIKAEQRIARQMIMSMTATGIPVIAISYFVTAWWMLFIYLAVISVNMLIAFVRMMLLHGEFDFDAIMEDF